jgi:hypothetical protein
MGLDGDDFVSGVTHGAIDVSLQLVQRFTADPAVAAVFEEQHRALARFGDGGLELAKVGYGRDACHIAQHFILAGGRHATKRYGLAAPATSR